MTKIDATRSLRWLFALPVAVACGWGLQTLHAPLPWMIGPLLCMAAINGMRGNVQFPVSGRYLGQWIVGCALGLYFTWPVLGQLGGMAGWIMLAVTLSLAVSLLAGRVLSRVGRVDNVTAFFASSVGGAAEMANQAERHGGRVDQVAAAQVTRVLFVVVTIPFLFQWLGLHGNDSYVAAAVALDPLRLSALLAGGLVAGWVLNRYRLPNAWLFGPLLLSAAFTGSGHPLSLVPAWMVNGGQLMIGCSLGARFSPAFFRESPRFLLGVVISGVVLLIGCTCIGVLVAALSGIPLPTAILATAPGGIAEMGLTAKVLLLGVPVVTAFHAARLVIVVLSAGPAHAWLSRRRQKR